MESFPVIRGPIQRLRDQVRWGLSAGVAICCMTAAPQLEAGTEVESIAETVMSLREIQIPEEQTTQVTPVARPLLKRLKQQLREFIEETLNGTQASAASAKKVNSIVLERLKHSGVAVGEDEAEDASAYGNIARIHVERPRGHNNLLAVTTELDIPCGSDTSLYLFKWVGGRWALALALEVNDYESIGSAQGQFGFAVSPPDAKKSYFVVAVDVNPWCWSNWQSVRYKALQVANDPFQPRTLMSRRNGIFLGNLDPVYRLRLTKGGFALAFWGDQDFGGPRVHVENYSVVGDRVTRTPPIASTPEGFLDEWLVLEWKEASRWVRSVDKLYIGAWHDRLRRNRKNLPFGVIFVQPCKKPSETWQIGLRINSKEVLEALPEEMFITISRKGKAFFVRGIHMERPPGCPGEREPQGDDEDLP